MEIDVWGLAAVLVGALVLAAALGLWHDMRHRSGPARLLTLTEAEHDRAVNMSKYYASIHGTEW